jgi:hypothetical protein
MTWSSFNCPYETGDEIVTAPSTDARQAART